MFSNIDWLSIILDYYFVMSSMNALAYTLASYSIYQWHISLTNLKYAIGLPKFAALLGSTALIRFGIVLIVATKYFDGTASTIDAILALGVVSLTLNTIFIVMFALMSYSDAKKLVYLTPEQRKVLVTTLNTFRELRMTTVESASNPIVPMAVAEKVVNVIHEDK